MASSGIAGPPSASSPHVVSAIKDSQRRYLSTDAETALRGQQVTQKTMATEVEAARAVAEPQSDMRGSADYKRTLVGSLVKRAIDIAVRRARGERIEAGHIYA